jgi:hypothetical protein
MAGLNEGVTKGADMNGRSLVAANGNAAVGA